MPPEALASLGGVEAKAEAEAGLRLASDTAGGWGLG